MIMIIMVVKKKDKRPEEKSWEFTIGCESS
jgi:hypothetical protein